MARCNLQPDFAKFSAKNTPDARINNYTRLQPSLAKIGVQLDTRTVTSLVREERGAATRLLSSLRMNLDAMVRDVEKAKVGTRLGQTAMSARTKPSLGVAESFRRTGAFNTARRGYDSQISRQFETTLRVNEDRPNLVMEQAHVAHFAQEKYRHQERVVADHVARKEEMVRELQHRRSQQVERFNSTRELKAANTTAAIASHQRYMSELRRMERTEVEIEMAIAEKDRLARLDRTLASKADTVDGIDEFEKNLERMREDPKTSRIKVLGKNVVEASAELTVGKIKPLTGVDPVEHLNSMQNSLPSGEIMQHFGDRYMDKVRAKAAEERDARKEREARRHKLLVDQQRTSAAFEAKKRQDDLLNALSAMSQQETRVAARLKDLEIERETMRENRQKRNNLYESQRAADYEASLRREATLAAQRRAAYKAAARAEAEDFADAELARKTAETEDVRVFCEDLVLALCGLAGRCADFREASDCEKVPRKEWREWTHLIVEGLPLPFALPEAEEEVKEEPPEVTALDRGTSKDYLTGAGEWDPEKDEFFVEPEPEPEPELDEDGNPVEPPEPEPEPEPELDADGNPIVPVPDPELKDIYPNQALASAVFDLSMLTLPEPEIPPTLPDLAGVQVRLAVAGMPFAGKSTAVAAIAEAQRLQIINPDILVKEAMAEAAAWNAEEEARVAASQPADDADAVVDADGSGGQPRGYARRGRRGGERRRRRRRRGRLGRRPCRGRRGGGARASRESSPAPRSRKVELGSIALAADGAGEPIPPDVVAALVAVAVGALAPPPPPPLTVVPEGDDHETALEAAKEADAAALAEWRASLDAEDRKRGFVIDGFPNSFEEAAALEKALTGLDPAREGFVRGRVSVVAPMREHEVAAKATPTFISGLDAVVVLELPTEPDAQAATRRAMGRRIDAMTGKIYHLEYDPPPEDEPGRIERLQDLVPPEEARVHERMKEWGAGVEKHEDWLEKFAGLRVGLDATGNVEEVADALTGVVERVLAAKAAAEVVKAASEDAAAAAAAAQTAAAAADEANAVVAACAKELLHLRKAEIQAKELVGAATAEAEEGADPPAETEEDAEPKDPAALALLAEKAAEAVAAELVKAQTAAAAADKALAEAAKAVEEANAAVKAASDSSAGAESVSEAREAAKAACEAAEAASVAAGESLESAKTAGEDVKGHVERAEAAAKAATPEEVAALDPDAPKEGEEGEGEPPADGENAPDDGEAPVEPEEQKPVPIVPVPLALADAIYEQWSGAETAYLEGMHQCFASMREERSLSLAHFVDAKKTFAEFLRRPDEKMTAVREFQSKFNDVDLDHRRDPRTKGELLVRADELRDALWDICDAKLQEAVDERRKIVDDTFVADHVVLATNHYVAMVQLELDKYAETHAVLADYFTARRGAELKEEGPEVTAPPDVLGEESPLPVPAADGEDTPTWLKDAIELTPTLAAAVSAALEYFKSVSPPEPDPEGEEASPEPAEDEEPPPPKTDAERAAETSAADLEEAMAIERHTVGWRMKRIVENAVAHAKHLKRVEAKALVRLEEYLRDRYHQECSAVAALVEEIKCAVDEERELVNDLILDDVDFIVLEEELAIPDPPPQPPMPPVEPPARGPGVFTASQLANLAAGLSSAAISGVMTAGECARVFARCAAVLTPADPGVPPAFSVCNEGVLAALARTFAFGDSLYCEWRPLIVSLLADMYPVVADASVERLASAAAQLAAPALAGRAAFANARKLWFLPAQANSSQVDVAAIVMRALADAFAFEPGEEGAVDVESLVLHLCASPASAEAGTRKALELAKVLAPLRLVPRRRGGGDGGDGGDGAAEPDGANGDAAAGADDATMGTEPAPTEEEGPVESPEAPIEPEPTPEPPPTPEAAAARFAAMGPMSHAAVELLTRHDVRGVDVDVPALLRAGDEGGAVGLLANPATARWFSRYLVRDLHAMVKV